MDANIVKGSRKARILAERTAVAQAARVVRELLAANADKYCTLHGVLNPRFVRAIQRLIEAAGEYV